MVPGKAPEVKLVTGHKLLIWWTLEASGGIGGRGLQRAASEPPGDPSGRAAMGGCPPPDPMGKALGRSMQGDGGLRRLAQSVRRGTSAHRGPPPPTTATGLFGTLCGLRRVGGWKVCLVLSIRLLLG